MITPSFGLTATERVLPKLALDFTTAILDPRVTFTRTTSATNPATYINSSGVITSATDNQPRFDYDPTTLVCKGLLIEESRTNLLLSTDVLATQIVTVTATSTTLSFYGTGEVVLSGAASATVTGTGAYPTRTTYNFTPTAGALTLTVTGTVQYAQLEAGAFPTSYIPTTTTALTRNADVATMTGTNFSDWFNATEGTFQVNAILTGQKTSFRGILAASNSTSLTYIGIVQASNGYSIRGNVLDNNVSQAALTLGTSADNTNLNATLSYKTNNFAGALNAAKPVTDVSGNIPTVSQLDIGYFGAGAQNTCYMKKIFYWPQRLTNNEVQAFSKG